MKYDNMDFKDAVRHESYGHGNQMRTLTTGVRVIGTGMREPRLTNAMTDPHRYTLTIEDIILSPGVSGDDPDGIQIAISRCLISNAI